jgi:alpha-L-rhamnosidase
VVPTAPPSASDPSTFVTITPPWSGLTHAAGTVPTPAGTLSVAWRTAADGRRLLLGVPPNAAARCRFPDASLPHLSEHGGPAAHAPGVQVLSAAPGAVVLEVGAGTYDFTASTTERRARTTSSPASL